MKPNHLELIKHLIDKPSNASILADQLDVSVRSIKNYVKTINDLYPNTITSSVKGYEINQKMALTILNETNYDIPQTSEDRVNFIITHLLKRNKDTSTNIYDLSNELYVSTSTLRNDLSKVKKKMKPFSLALIQEGDWLSVEGLEKNKRKILSSMLYEESTVNFVNLESLQNAFIDIDIEFIRITLLTTFDKYHYFINDYSLINLILHITIAIDRIRNKSVDPCNSEEVSALDITEFEIAKEIAEILSDKFNVDFDTGETNELSLLIASRASALDYKNISKTNIESYIGTDLLQLVNHLVESINVFFHRNLFDDDFLVRFALHIKSLLIRSENNQFSKNPLSDSIRRTSPLIYESSVNLASELKAKTGMSINDDEIAYIAFHIGSAIKNVESMKEKAKVVYYCPNYHNIHNNVVDFIKEYFENDLIITNIITDESQINEITSADFILTSIPIATVTLIPIVHIAVFPNDNDRIKLTEVIAETRKEKERKQFESYLRELLLENLFEVNTEITDYVTCIEHMSQKLIDEGYVYEDFTKDVLEREKLSSTAFSGAAIPHSMYMNANKTTISILINPNGIKWGKSNVNLVIMMSFKKTERFIFNEIFEPITMILTDLENLNALTSVKNYEDFIRVMANFL